MGRAMTRVPHTSERRAIMAIPDHAHPLDVYDMAVLAGGLPRLVDTVLVAMVEAGRVRVEPSGEFHADATSSPHPVEAALLDAVGTRGYRSVDGIGSRFLHDRRLDQEFRHLTSDGLVRRAYPARLVGKTHAHTTAAGRRALQRFAERPPADGGNAVQVALHGRDAMPDHRLHDDVFAPRSVVVPPRSARRPSHEVHAGELGQPPYRPGTDAIAGEAHIGSTTGGFGP
jgi:hypothetical protein